MANPIRLLILLADDNSERLDLSEMPDTLEDLIEQVKETCKLTGDIRLQYKDVTFGETFVNLTSTSMIKDLTTIKVIQSAPAIAPGFAFVQYLEGSSQLMTVPTNSPADESDLDASSLSANTDSKSDSIHIPRYR